MKGVTLRAHTQQQFETLARRYEPHEVLRTAWGSRTEQIMRFDVLMEIGSLEGQSLLDAGCGVGDLYGYLQERGWHGQYTGYDLVAANCQAAADKYGQVLFFHQDILETTATEQFDYVLASGLFNLAADDWSEAVRQTLTRLFSLCRVGLAVNFLSCYSTDQVPQLAYADLTFVIEICAGLTRRFILRHDYASRRNDFTLYAYRD